MYRKLVLIIFILINLKSDNINNNLKDNYQIVANKLETNKDIIIASGDVIIFSKSYYMKAQKIIYNKPKETFELFGDVFLQLIIDGSNI